MEYERTAQESALEAILAKWAASPATALGLDVSVGLTAATLQRAYLKLARICHPDKGGTHKVFLAVKAARDALADRTDGNDDDLEPVVPAERYYFSDDPLRGAVHDDCGYESRFWSDEVAGGSGRAEREAMWARYDREFEERQRAREAGYST